MVLMVFSRLGLIMFMWGRVKVLFRWVCVFIRLGSISVFVMFYIVLWGVGWVLWGCIFKMWFWVRCRLVSVGWWFCCGYVVGSS